MNVGEPAGATPLCWAAEGGLLEVMPELLARGADINGDVHDSSRPRDRGCYHRTDVVAYLQSLGAESACLHH